MQNTTIRRLASGAGRLGSAAVLVLGLAGPGAARAAVAEVEPNDTPSQATPLAAGPLSAAFPPAGGGTVGVATLDPGDVDHFSFELAAGELATLQVVTPDAGAVADPTLELLDPTDTPVAADDDGGPGLLPALRHRAAVGGVFTAAVAGFRPEDASSDYRLVVSVTTAPPATPEALPDANGTPAAADPLPPGGTALDLEAPGGVAVLTGDVAPGDVDYFQVQVPAGQGLSVFVWDESAGAAADPVLGVFDSAGTSVGGDDDSGPGFDSSLTSTPAAAGNPVLLGVGTFGDALFDGNGFEPGFTYQLVVALAPLAQLLCDATGDGAIDVADVGEIFDARGTAAGPGDVRDADADGLLTVLDARICALACDDTNCIPPGLQAQGCGLLGPELLAPCLALWARRRRPGRPRKEAAR